MSTDEKLALVKAMSGETDDSVILAYLNLAGEKICRIAYPFNDSVTTVPQKYDQLHIEATVYLLNKRGGEGESSHSENGIARTYESADLPISMLRVITPMCGGVSNANA